MHATDGEQSRRGFLQRSLAMASVGGTLASLAPDVFAQKAPGENRLRLAIVGTGARCVGMWGPKMEKEYGDRIEIVGLCDINPKRVQYVQSLFATKPAAYTNFDKMIHETSPRAVIITTVDSSHVPYSVRAMELGCDVICEKPVATTAEDCQLLHDAEAKTERKFISALNARYLTEATKVKELLVSGAIGDLYSVNYAEMLDLTHGASYFRRWHGEKTNSGTLLCTKASHHFDQVNWWTESEPDIVQAFGALKVYGKNGQFRSTHCRVCPHQSECKFHWDITKREKEMRLYVECEDADGYLRDGCLYREEIDIYDTMSLQCRFKNGVILTYSLDAASPIEGQIITLNGSKGRIELRAFKRQPWKPEAKQNLRLITNNPLASQTFELKHGKGGHGGADPALMNHIFYPNSADPHDHRAGSRAGIYASLIGIAGYQSIESCKPVAIDDLVKLG